MLDRCLNLPVVCLVSLREGQSETKHCSTGRFQCSPDIDAVRDSDEASAHVTRVWLALLLLSDPSVRCPRWRTAVITLQDGISQVHSSANEYCTVSADAMVVSFYGAAASRRMGYGTLACTTPWRGG
jgi:hypothetical protein